MSEKHYEMLWDCQFCGTEKLLGFTHRHCPVCGAPQDPDARYYPSDDEKIAVEDHEYAGADKICDSCNALNSGSAEYCGNCGAPLTDAARARKLASESRGQGEKFQSSGSRDVVKEKFDAEMERIGVKQGASQGFNWKMAAIIGVIALVVIGVIAALTVTREQNVVVTGHSWERVINVDEYVEFREESWHNRPPAGDDVFRLSGTCVERQRGTERVPDGQTCRTVREDLGNGTFREREECTPKYKNVPVYDDWCTFTGKRWEFSYDVKTSGVGLQESPYWGEVNLRCENQRQIGCERQSTEEAYLVHFSADGPEYECPFNQSEWAQIAVDSIWTVHVRVVDAGAADCNSLQPAQ